MWRAFVERFACGACSGDVRRGRASRSVEIDQDRAAGLCDPAQVWPASRKDELSRQLLIGRLPPQERLRPPPLYDWEVRMHKIQIRLPSDHCDEPVQQMRGWIKAHQCELLEFSCHDLGRRTTVVVVEFKTESERSSFAEQFAAGLR